MFGLLTKENFLLYAMKYYDNPNCHSMEEFKSDLKRIKYIKRLLNRYIDGGGPLRERLILNHIIILTNSFGVEMAVKMLFFRVNADVYPALKTFLVFLNMMPDYVEGISEIPIKSSEIPLDMEIVNCLRKI